MVRFTALIKRFATQGEKTGWTYIDVPGALAQQLVPGNKKGFRVKGKLDNYSFEKLALLPMGGGDFILTLNAATRKGIRKQKGDKIEVQMQVDKTEILPPAELIECLRDEPEAFEYYQSLPQGHRNYFTNWIGSAKTEITRSKRIAATVNAMFHRWDYGQMIRAMQKEKLQ